MADLTRRELLLSAGGAAAMAVTGTTSAQETADGEWPMFGHDVGNTHTSPDGTGPTAGAGPLWSAETDEQVTTSAAVVGEQVYVGGGGNGLHAFDAETGDEVWQFQTDGRIRSSPAVVDEMVYVGSGDGHLYAIDAEEGDLAWRFETDGSVVSSPTVFDGTVYVGSLDRHLYAIDAHEGEEHWSIDTQAEIRSSPAVARPSEDDETPTTVYVGTDDGTVHAVDAESGERRWVVAVDGSVRGAPVVVEDTLYVGSISGSFTGYVYALDATVDEADVEEFDDVLQWQVETDGAVVAAPAATGDAVFAGTRTGIVYAFEADDGDERWQFDTGEQSQILASPAVASDVVYVSSESEGVFALGTDDGDERWRVDSGGSVQSSPVVALGRLYVASGNAVYALEEGLDGDIGTDTHGMGDGPGDTTGGPEPDGGEPLGGFTFLLWPVSLAAILAMFAGVVYAAKRTGVLDRIEEAADAYGGDDEDEVARDATTDSTADGSAAGGSSAGRSTSASGDDGDGTERATGGQPGATPMWELVIDDVIGRAEETARTATDDLLVTKYVDSGTLESPVVAYEVESFRDAPARVRLTEPLLVEAVDDESRPRGDNWTVDDDELVFEAVVEPDGTARTIVGRRDCPDDRLDDLAARPDVAVEEG